MIRKISKYGPTLISNMKNKNILTRIKYGISEKDERFVP